MYSTTTDAAATEPSEPYQKLLHTFLSKVPADGTEVQSGTPVKPYPYTAAELADVIKSCKTNKVFKDLTFIDHSTLLTKWLNDRTTSCNLIITSCLNAMGYKGKLTIGRFDIRDQLLGNGLGHCWIDPLSGALPEYGDIFRLYAPTSDHNGVPLNHMGVVLQMVGNDMHTVEGGQGGPAKGYDSVRRKVRTWPVHGMQGWVSTRALLAAEAPVPYWQGGWWQVDESPYDTYWYYFAAGGKVSYCAQPPVSFRAPPASATLLGQSTPKGMFGCEIRWQSDDAPETLTMSMQSPKERLYMMKGKTAKGAEISLKKILEKDAML